jgi:hypothetical protein
MLLRDSKSVSDDGVNDVGVACEESPARCHCDPANHQAISSSQHRNIEGLDNRFASVDDVVIDVDAV